MPDTPTTPMVHLGFCLVLSWQLLTGFAVRIPIGAIFDHNLQEIQSAFSNEIMNHNSNNQLSQKLSSWGLEAYTPRLTLDAQLQIIQLNDSYSLSSTICSQMANGIFTLFGSHSVVTLPTLRSFTSTFHMPFVTTSMAVQVSGQELGYVLYMRPLYTQAIIDVIKQYHWPKVYYIYSTKEGLFRLQQLFEAISEDGLALAVKVIRVHDVAHVLKIIKHLNEISFDDKRILLDMPTRDCDALLREQRSDARRVNLHYLLVGLGMTEMQLDSYTDGGINITGFQLVDSQHSKTWGRFGSQSWHSAGDTKTSSYEAALAVDSVHLISKALTKLLTQDPYIFSNTLHRGKFYNYGTEGIDCDFEPIIPWRHGYAIMKAMKEIEFNGLSGKVAFDSTGLRRDFSLNILQVHLDRGLTQIGSWTPRKGLEKINLLESPSLVGSKGNNHNAHRTLIVTSILTEPYLTLRTDSPNSEPLFGNDKYEGYCADLAKIISEIVGYKYLINPVKDGKYGSKDKDGSWNGMVGELVRNEADLAIAPLTITFDRERVIDFSKPFMSLGISIMIKKPTDKKPGVFSFMYPLSSEIWMCIIFAYIGVSVMLFLVSRCSPLEWYNEENSNNATTTNSLTIFNTLWFSLAAFTQQKCVIEPRSISGRIVGSAWWFFTLIIISSYTANLAAFLTVEKMQSPIESVNDLAKQTKIRYGTVEGGTTMEFFRGSTQPIFERMWRLMSSAEPNVFVASNEDGVKQVRESNGRYAFFIESTTIDYINQRKPCDTIKIGRNLDSKGYGIATPRGSDLRDKVTGAVLELRENGNLGKLEKKWWYDKGECGEESSAKKDEKDATSALRLTNVVGVFYILFGSMVLALLMVVIEFLYKSKVESRRRKTSFSNVASSKLRLSIKGKQDSQQPPTVGSPDLASNMSVSKNSPTPHHIRPGRCVGGNIQTEV